MNQYIEALNRHFAEQELSCGYPGVESVMDALYYCFCIHSFVDTQKIRDGFRQMDLVLRKLSHEENDRLSDITCDLCEQYQRAAFREGFLVGFRLFRELEAVETAPEPSTGKK